MEELHNKPIQERTNSLLRVLQGLTLQEQVEAILENKGWLFVTTTKGKGAPQSRQVHPNQREKDIRGLKEKVLMETKKLKHMSNSKEPTLSIRPTNVEVPKELPKVSMVNTSLKKRKHHLANFDVVVKERTTPTAITDVSWGFDIQKLVLRMK
ncbi:hypothetical protein Tco_0886844 [Tanacetum coccineum]